MKPNETKEWQEDLAKKIVQRLNEGGKLLIKVLPPKSRTSLTWRYEVSLVYMGRDNEITMISLTYWLASCLGLKVKEGQLAENEFGTERNFVVAYKVWQVLASFGLVERQFSNQHIYLDV